MEVLNLEPKHGPFIGGSFNVSLKQAILDLLAETRKETQNTSTFIDAFYSLMQARANPPLDSIWVYAALTFRRCEFVKGDVFDRATVARDLFKLTSACSASCSSVSSVALLAPVVFEVHKVVVELLGKESLSSKRDKKAMREIRSLIETMLGYMSICCFNGSFGETGFEMSADFVDLVGIWLGGEERLENFFPLLSGDISRALLRENDWDINYLAGVVITEAFLLKICLHFHVGVGNSRAVLERDLRSLAVASITGLRSSYFFETLGRMLIETSLPVDSLLCSEDQASLRKVLHDAIILVGYSFLTLEQIVDLPAEHIKNLLMTRLVVAYEAIEFFRELGDQSRAISYINAFSTSGLPSQIIKLMRSQIGIEETVSESVASSPRALIRWLLELQSQGLRLFGDTLLKCCAKLVSDVSVANAQPAMELEDRKEENDVLFYIDNKGEEEDVDGDEETKDIDESTSAAFIAAAHTMEMTENGGEKRKRAKNSQKEKQIKFLKYGLAENSDSRRERLKDVRDNDAGSASEVDKSLSDEDD